MAIATTNDLIAAMTGAQTSNPTVPQRFGIVKTQAFTTIAGGYESMWLATGTPTAATGGPGAWATQTSATVGGLVFTAPAGSHTLYLSRLASSWISVGNVILYDRLGAMSGLSGTSVAAQNINSGALPSGRCDTTGIGVDWFVEVYTTLGVTPRTLTFSYTDDTGATGLSTAVTIPASMPQGRLLPILPGAGKKGIKSIETGTLSGTTGTVGDFGVTAGRKMYLQFTPYVGGGDARGPMELGLPAINSNTCFWFVGVSNAAAANGNLLADLTLIEG